MERTPVRRARVAAEVRAEMARQNITKARLAQAMGLSVDTLRRRLDGVYPFLFEEVDAACSFFNISLPDFYSRVMSGGSDG